ncbi:MAG: aminopeptidase N, partial [Pseudomonadota bacterium]|nr:aminopeptidase N [Pseudomonadota bacterium]
MNTPATIYRKDYQPPHFLITETFLDVDIRLARTRVKSRLTMSRHGEHHEPLILNGQSLQLISVQLDGVDLTPEQYEATDETLSITGLPAKFELAIEVEIQPKDNLSLEGLYCSNGMYCTQCEAEGFRRITYYLDRPDVLSVFTTRIEADSDQYPVLLSNGNQLAQETISSTRHAVTWYDPHPKPCYLFALVAGDLACKSDYFRTAEGRDVSIEFYVEPKDLDKLEHGVQSLKNAMRWDEETYGLSYDLDRYMIVAVSHFNMGAMENKGLNIFNTSCVLASPDTATDKGYQLVEGVIAHEYFHNWSGNRVTCRDWFQLSLKEGFTVFRDAQFSADMNSTTIKRIEDVQLLKSMQFPEDAGPQAHPIRPDSYITIDNFYTMTVYEKGAEVIRMFSTLLGWPAFRAGSDLYFERHDGQAVTCDDFIQAMEDASGKDLSQFSRWYSQAGTPTVKVRDHYDAELQTYTLNLSQTTPATPGQAQKLPLVIPIRFGFLTAEGEPLVLATGSEAVEEDLLLLTEQEQTVVFKDVKQKPTPSLLRDFSAPVYLDYVYSNEQLANLMRHDENEYNRWQAGQAWAMNILQANICACATDPEAFSD